jgi:hypothetical protein
VAPIRKVERWAQGFGCDYSFDIADVLAELDAIESLADLDGGAEVRIEETEA